MSTITKNEIIEVLQAIEGADISSAKMYVKCLSAMKDCVSVESTAKGLKDMIKEVATELKSSKYFTQKVNNVVSIAEATIKYKLHTMEGNSNNIKLYFYNIEKSVNLLQYVSENYTEEVVTSVKNKLNKVKKVADKKEYNDAYSKVLKELYKEYKIVMTDDSKVVKIAITKEGLQQMVTDLSPEMKDYLRTLLA